MTNFCVCHSTHEDEPIVQCVRCRLSFHALCLGIDPTRPPSDVICPLCLCQTALKRSVDAVQRIVQDSLAKLPENRGNFVSTVKHPLVVTICVGELNRYIAEFLSPRGLDRLAILPANSEFRSGRRKPIQDKPIREFLLTKLQMMGNHWLASLLLQGENLDALKIGSLQHVNSPREWFLLLRKVLRNSQLFLDLSLPNHAQSLPGEFVLLIEESLRLDFFSHPTVLEIIQQLFVITFCGVAHNLVQFPRDFAEWKRVQEIHRLFLLDENEPVIQFVQKVGITAVLEVDDRAVRSVDGESGGFDSFDDADGEREGADRRVSERINPSPCACRTAVMG